MTMPSHALTPDEWARPLCTVSRGLTTIKAGLRSAHEPYPVVTVAYLEGEEHIICYEALHALAALSLYNEAHGFTHADVALLRAMGDTSPDSRMTPNWLRHSKDLAARIEALLPPPSAPATNPALKGKK